MRDPAEFLELAMLRRLTGRAVDRDDAGESWVALDSERAAMFHALERGWSALDEDLRIRDDVWQRAAWSAVRDRARIGDTPKRSAARVLSIRLRRRISSIWIAGVATLCLGGVVWYSRNGTSSDVRLIHRYSTRVGQRADVSLPGGTRITLGPATTVAVGASTHNVRTLTVTGQVLVTAIPDRQQSTLVRTRNAVARVLGTTFLVRQYNIDRIAVVVVSEGRVAVQSVRSTQQGVLTAQTMGTVDDSGHVRVTPVNDDDYNAWTRGTLVFHETPVRDIITELNRVYGAQLRLGDSSLAVRALTWSVPVAHRSLTGVVWALTEALGAHAVQRGSVITIVPGHPVSHTPMYLDTISTQEIHYGR